MNGTIYEEIKRKGDSKKKEKLKFFLTLISTNLLIATLCLSFGPNDNHPKALAKISKTIHPNFKMIIVPLSVLIDINPDALETPITLLNKSKKILIPKAYLHEMLPASNKDFDNIQRFKIEIPEDQIIKLSEDAPDTMIAIPELKITQTIKKPQNKRVSLYEIDI
ncbi:MAG: hypothetical protein Q7U04_15580 [Bacteriovorax sp.]|nr:hypothetical protein [Bacteriovorax sp.]